MEGGEGEWDSRPLRSFLLRDLDPSQSEVIRYAINENYIDIMATSFNEVVREEKPNTDAITAFFKELVYVRGVGTGLRGTLLDQFENRPEDYKIRTFDASVVVQKAVTIFLETIARRGKQSGIYKKFGYAAQSKHNNKTFTGINEKDVMDRLSDTFVQLFIRYNFKNIRDTSTTTDITPLTFDILPMIIKEAKLSETWKKWEKTEGTGRSAPPRFLTYFMSRGTKRPLGFPDQAFLPETKDLKRISRDLKIDDMLLSGELDINDITSGKRPENGTRYIAKGNMLLAMSVLKAMRFIFNDDQLFMHPKKERGKRYVYDASKETGPKYSSQAEDVLKDMYVLYYISSMSMLARLGRRPFIDISFLAYPEKRPDGTQEDPYVQIVRYQHPSAVHQYGFPEEYEIERETLVRFQPVLTPMHMRVLHTKRDRRTKVVTTDRSSKVMGLLQRMKEYALLRTRRPDIPLLGLTRLGGASRDFDFLPPYEGGPSNRQQYIAFVQATITVFSATVEEAERNKNNLKHTTFKNGKVGGISLSITEEERNRPLASGDVYTPTDLKPMETPTAPPSVRTDLSTSIVRIPPGAVLQADFLSDTTQTYFEEGGSFDVEELQQLAEAIGEFSEEDFEFPGLPEPAQEEFNFSDLSGNPATQSTLNEWLDAWNQEDQNYGGPEKQSEPEEQIIEPLEEQLTEEEMEKIRDLETELSECKTELRKCEARALNATEGNEKYKALIDVLNQMAKHEGFEEDENHSVIRFINDALEDVVNWKRVNSGPFPLKLLNITFPKDEAIAKEKINEGEESKPEYNMSQETREEIEKEIEKNISLRSIMNTTIPEEGPSSTGSIRKTKKTTKPIPVVTIKSKSNSKTIRKRPVSPPNRILRKKPTITISANEAPISIFDVTGGLDSIASADRFCSSWARDSNHYRSLVHNVESMTAKYLSPMDSDIPIRFHNESSTKEEDEEEESYRSSPYEEEEKSYRPSTYEEEKSYRSSPYEEEDSYRSSPYEEEDSYRSSPYEEEKSYRSSPYEEDPSIYKVQRIPPKVELEEPNTYTSEWRAGMESYDPWDEGFGAVYNGYSSSAVSDPYAYASPSTYQRMARDYSMCDTTGRFTLSSSHNAALTMLVAGTLTIASKRIQRECGMEKISSSNGNGSGFDASGLAEPKTFNISCKKVQRGSEEEVRNVYEEIFGLWDELEPFCGEKNMRKHVESLAESLGNGDVSMAERSMVLLCRSINLSSATTNTMRQLVEQMHRAVVRYRCSRCKDMKQFKTCVRNACEVVAHNV